MKKILLLGVLIIVGVTLFYLEKSKERNTNQIDVVKREITEVVEWDQAEETNIERQQRKTPESKRRLQEEALPQSMSHESYENIQEYYNTEEYAPVVSNSYKFTYAEPVSTFSADVDNASYTNCRRFINSNYLPDKGAVRTEEFINYFSYDYPQPKNKHPFSITTEYGDCPWNENHKLVHIGLQGKKIDKGQLPPNNLVFLLDVSGSMSSYGKLPLVKKGFKMLVNQLDERDIVSITVYAGNAGLVLPPTRGDEKDKILEALDRLEAGGSTAGGKGIKLAYKTAKDNFIKDGNNRVILATDGDFNVGVSSTSELTKLIEEKRKDGIFLSVLGFGMGNYKDDRLEEISNKGNGNYAYIDNVLEAKKVFITDLLGTLYTIAKDVKIQVEFNPVKVQGYRLIGYENRILNKEDFNDDTKDAGEIGVGHTVTALYEIIPAGVDDPQLKKPDTLKYQTQDISKEAKSSDEILTVKFRYKKPDGDKSILITDTVKDNPVKLSKTSDNFRFSAAAAGFAMILKDSEYKGRADFELVKNLAKKSKGQDVHGYRSEFIQLVEKAEIISENQK